MTSRVVRSDGTTEITNIKSLIYTEKTNADTDLRPGGVYSASLELEVYGSVSDAPDNGEALTYYQTNNAGVETLIGVFYAEPAITTKATYKVTAYDAAAKLDVDYSARLSAIQSNFPMTLSALVSDACNVAGVTLASTTFPNSTIQIGEFYADGITCRQIVGWAAEIACRFVRCNTAGRLVFDWYTLQSSYRVYPTSGTSSGETYVAYKQNGLSYEKFFCKQAGSVAVQPPLTTSAAFIYPTSVAAVYATDPNGDGNVILHNLVATDPNNDGNVALSGNFDAVDDGFANVEISSLDTDNSLIITGNLLLTSSNSTVCMQIAQHIFNTMRALPVYRPCTINVFPGENPLRAGHIVPVTDIQGVSFTTIIMSCVVKSSGTQLQSTGNEAYEKDYYGDSSSQLVNLSAGINNAHVDLEFTERSIKATVAEAQSKYDEESYTVTLYGYGTPTVAGYSASGNNGAYYLNQSNGYLYLSNGTTWTYVKTLSLITSNLSSTISQLPNNITLSVSNNSTSSTITLSGTNVTTQSETISMSGLVSFTNLSTQGQTNIDGGNITTGTLSADRIAANSIAVGKLTGSISNGGWEVDLGAGTMTLGTLAVGSITGSLTGGLSNSWGINFSTGTLTIGNISANNITTGTLDASQVSVTNLNADNITSGTLQSGDVKLGGLLDVYADSAGSSTLCGQLGGYYTMGLGRGLTFISNGNMRLLGEFNNNTYGIDLFEGTIEINAITTSGSSDYALIAGTSVYLYGTDRIELNSSDITLNGSTSMSGNLAIGDSTTSYTLTLNGQSITSGSFGNMGYYYYGTSSTAATTRAKVASVSGVTSLTSGLVIKVKFTYANTYSSYSPTLNVNSLGAKTVRRDSATTPVNRFYWPAGEVVTFEYDGTYWNIVSDGSKHTTIWTNSSPTSAFAAQSLAFSKYLSWYEQIQIEYRKSTSINDLDSKIIPYESNSGVVLSYLDTEDGICGYFRYVSISASGAVFSRGYGEDGTSQNSGAIPLRIIGII